MLSNTNFCFFSDHFYIILPSITRTMCFKRVTSKKNRLTVMIRFSAQGAFFLLASKEDAYSGQGAYFCFEKQPNVQLKGPETCWACADETFLPYIHLSSKSPQWEQSASQGEWIKGTGKRTCCPWILPRQNDHPSNRQKNLKKKSFVWRIYALTRR